jgi:hypothetical protein
MMGVDLMGTFCEMAWNQADVVCVGQNAVVFCSTHSDRVPGQAARDDLYEHRRGSIQLAQAHVADGSPVRDRDKARPVSILPIEGR